MSDLIRAFRILRHHEQKRFLPALVPFLFRFQPARVPDHQLFLKAI